ncbi:hypothetical protein RM545_17240, partial [Zunongwangia sp. F260]
WDVVTHQMKRVIKFILVIVFFSNCSNSSDNRTFERTAVIYNGFEEKREEKFTANVGSKINLIYKYVSQTDSTKTVSIKVGEDSQLYFEPFEFIRSDRNGLKAENLSDDLFHYYELKDPVTDGTGPILFNEDYGLLAIYNVYGPTIIFLNDETLEMKNQILDSLNN